MESKVIELSGAGWLADGRMVLRPASLVVMRGDFIVVTGPNGGGKTTLLRLMLKLLRPSAGRVAYFTPDGRVADRISIGYLPQKNSIDSKFPVTVGEVVASGMLASNVAKATARAMVEEWMVRFGLLEKRDVAIGRLSGGQLQRTLIARALVADPEVVVLDEPLSYLDEANADLLAGILASMKGRKTIIVVTHDVGRFAKLASRRLVVEHGLVRGYS